MAATDGGNERQQQAAAMGGQTGGGNGWRQQAVAMGGGNWWQAWAAVVSQCNQFNQGLLRLFNQSQHKFKTKNLSLFVIKPCSSNANVS